MLGNVWGWCSDVYNKDYYTTPQNTDPTGPSEELLESTEAGVGLTMNESTYQAPGAGTFQSIGSVI